MTEIPEKKKSDWAKMKFNINDFFTGITLPLCAILCSLSLTLIAVRLGPVAKWASFQSLCVEAESQKSPIEWAVRKCNGRSKVYQVK